MRLLALGVAAAIAAWVAQIVIVPQPPTADFPTDPVAVRDTYLCLVPDIQNLTSQDDEVPNPDTCQSGSPAIYGCMEPYCTHSAYCKDSWWQTGRQLLLSQAYEMTGQWEKIDYTGISGTDPTQSHWTGAKDHPRCDVILSLGDNTDIDDVIRAQDPDYATLGTTDAYQHGQRQVDTVQAYYDVLDASGIPYIITQGNHDPEKIIKALLTRYHTTSKSWYYQTEGVYGVSYAIKAPMPFGKSLCVVTLQWGNSIGTGDPTDPADYNIPLAIQTWADSVIGCGASLPTVLISHAGVGFAHVQATSADAPVFLFAYGHFIQDISIKLFSSGGAGGFSFFSMFSNWQEENRWGSGEGSINAGLGNTPSDSQGGWYTIVRISPTNSIVEAWDWSPYWLSRNQRFATSGTTTIRRSFPWDTRYP